MALGQTQAPGLGRSHPHFYVLDYKLFLSLKMASNSPLCTYVIGVPPTKTCTPPLPLLKFKKDLDQDFFFSF